MSDLSLSQEEIDKLLSLGGVGGLSKPKKQFTPQQKAAVEQLFQELSPSLEQALRGMLEGLEFQLSLKMVDIKDRDEFLDLLSKDQEIVELRVDLKGDITTSHGIYLSSDHAIKLAGPVMGQGSVELNGASMSALEEVANQIASTVVNFLSEKFNKKNIHTTPVSGQKFPKAMITAPDDILVALVWDLKIGTTAVEMAEYFVFSAFQPLLALETAKVAEAPSPGAQAVPPPSGFGPQGPTWMGAPGPMPGMPGMPGMGPMPGMSGPAPMPGMPPAGTAMPQAPGMMGAFPGFMPGMAPGQVPYYPNVQSVQFPALNQVPEVKDVGNLGLLMDVTMELTVELGRAKRQIKDILGMGEGTIITLDKLAGEAVDILVNHKLIAKGEVVVIEENFGVRVTEIVTNPEKRES